VSVPLQSMGFGAFLSFNALLTADISSNNALMTAGSVFVYIGTIIVAFGLSLRGSGHHKKAASDTPAGERTGLV